MPELVYVHAHRSPGVTIDLAQAEGFEFLHPFGWKSRREECYVRIGKLFRSPGWSWFIRYKQLPDIIQPEPSGTYHFERITNLEALRLLHAAGLPRLDQSFIPQQPPLLHELHREILRSQVHRIIDGRIEIATEYVRLRDLYHPRFAEFALRQSNSLLSPQDGHEPPVGYVQYGKELSQLTDSMMGEFHRFEAEVRPQVEPDETPDDLRLWIESQLAWFEERMKLLDFTVGGRAAIARNPSKFPKSIVEGVPAYPEDGVRDLAREAFRRACAFSGFLPSIPDSLDDYVDPVDRLNAIAALFGRISGELEEDPAERPGPSRSSRPIQMMPVAPSILEVSCTIDEARRDAKRAEQALEGLQAAARRMAIYGPSIRANNHVMHEYFDKVYAMMTDLAKRGMQLNLGRGLKIVGHSSWLPIQQDLNLQNAYLDLYGILSWLDDPRCHQPGCFQDVAEKLDVFADVVGRLKAIVATNDITDSIEATDARVTLLERSAGQPQVEISTHAGAIANPPGRSSDSLDRPAGYLGLILDETKLEIRRQGHTDSNSLTGKLQIEIFKILLNGRDTYVPRLRLRIAWTHAELDDNVNDERIDGELSNLRKKLRSLGISIVSKRSSGWRLQDSNAEPV